MRIDLKQPIRGRKNEQLKEGDEAVTLELIAYSALTAMTAQEQQTLSREERLKRGRLAQRITIAQDGIDLKSEEIAIIKQCIGNCYGPWVVAQTEDMLEGVELKVVEK